MLQTEDLVAFAAIARELHFSRASDGLGIAQSVLSKRLRRLESHFGFELIDRSNRFKVAVTAQGRILLEESKATLLDLERLEIVGRNIKRGAAGPIRLGYVFSAGLNGLVTETVRTIRRVCDPAEIELLLLDTPRQMEKLQNGEIDLALTRPCASYPWDKLVREVHVEDLMVAFHPDYLRAEGSDVDIEDLRECQLIVPQFPNESSVSPALAQILGDLQLHQARITRTEDFVSAACLAASGAGVVLCPRSLKHVGVPELRFCSVRNLDTRLRLMLVWRPDTPKAVIDALHGNGDAKGLQT